VTTAVTSELHWRRLILAAVLLTVFFAPGHFATPDAHVRLAQARNLVDFRSMAVPEGVGNLTHGNLAQGRDGRMYSVYNPGHPLLLAPAYWVAKALPTRTGLHDHYTAAFLGSFLGLFAHFVNGLVVLALLRQLGVSRRRGLLVAGLFAIGTVSLPSATDGYEHPFEALAVCAAFLCVAAAGKERSGDRFSLLAGFLIGLGILFRYTAVLALPGVLLTSRDTRARLLAIAGTLPAILVMLLYNWYRFGSFLDTGYPSAWRLSHGDAIGANGFDIWQIPGNAIHLLTSPGKGLIWFAPAVVLGLVGWHGLRRSHPRLTTGIAATGVLYLLFYSANFAWHGSVWSWGPRYLIPMVPLLMLPVAFPVFSGRWIWLVRFIVVWSISVQAVAVTADYRRHLLLEYSRDIPAFEHRLLHDPVGSPVLGQFRSAAHVLSTTLRTRELHPYISPGPWTDVARPASIEMMLDSSIDLNVVNVWWVRLPFFVTWGLPSFLSLLFGGLVLLASTLLLRSIWIDSA
jgi:hypothetical protein